VINSFADLLPLLPELVLVLCALLVLMVGAFVRDPRSSWVHVLSLFSLVAVAFSATYAPMNPKTLGGLFAVDSLSLFFRQFLPLLTGVVLIYARHGMEQRKLLSGEFYALVLFALLGMLLLCSGSHMLSLYLGLELLGLSSYALVALDRDSRGSTEAAMKYFVLGSIASAVLLYGISILYGLTGSLELASINEAAVRMIADGDQLAALTFGLVFVLVGLAFKFGAVPFHMWLPDVYQGAPTPVTLFIASVPKLAAVGMALRLLPLGLSALLEQWQEVLAVLAAASLILGNLAAIAQTNIKRMLAYSAISHVGFLFMGLLNGTPLGMTAILFYGVIYALMTASAFGLLMVCARSGVEINEIDDFRGLNQKQPFYAFLLLLTMASLAGFPPLVGFFGKLLVLQASIDAGYLWLAIVAAICAVIGAFYYLRVIKAMYFDESSSAPEVSAPLDVRIVLTVNALALLGLGIFWSPLAQLCSQLWSR
jgi:NADH-quinone oxidoreductase subunit N